MDQHKHQMKEVEAFIQDSIKIHGENTITAKLIIRAVKKWSS
jgi:hypothetical protein